jgi:hypothetical protein
MKITPYAIRTVVAAGALVLVSSGAANAQLLDNMKFTTSFPFMIGKQQLPAGAYTVSSAAGQRAAADLERARLGAGADRKRVPSSAAEAR